MQTTVEPRADDSALPRELTAPFDAHERTAMLDAVFAQVDRAVPATDVRELGSVSGGTRARTGMLVAFALAVAAALVLWVAKPAPVGANLPDYTLTELQGGVMSVRSDPGAVDRPLHISTADRIEIVASPATPVPGPLVVDLVAQATERAPQMARVPAEVS
jgi:hypothetical protein